MTKKMTRKKNNHKVTLSQGGVEATFHLDDREYNLLLKCLVPHDNYRIYNFAAFAWAYYDISRSKCGRFHSIFDYNKGDFLLMER